MIHQFHEFFESGFWRLFCNMAQLCATVATSAIATAAAESNHA
jgi:hypothetical protein